VPVASVNLPVKAIVNLSVEVASTGVDRWRFPPNTPLLDLTETLGSNLQIHLKQGGYLASVGKYDM
jgi:hypothetical protein